MVSFVYILSQLLYTYCIIFFNEDVWFYKSLPLSSPQVWRLGAPSPQSPPGTPPPPAGAESPTGPPFPYPPPPRPPPLGSWAAGGRNKRGGYTALYGYQAHQTLALKKIKNDQ